MKTLKINPQVLDDLQDIKNYIAEDSIQQAEKVINKILDDMERLTVLPEVGTRLMNKIRCSGKYRYIITYSYATVYFIEGENVIIVTVLHLARDFAVLQELL